jgi:hypothetical protein
MSRWRFLVHKTAEEPLRLSQLCYMGLNARNPVVYLIEMFFSINSWRILILWNAVHIDRLFVKNIEYRF